MVCFCQEHQEGPAYAANTVRYIAAKGNLTRTDQCAGTLGLRLNQDYGTTTPGTTVGSFCCGLTPCCADDSAQWDLMANGTIVPRSNHAVCIGAKSAGAAGSHKSKLILVPVGSPEALIFEDILRGTGGAPQMPQMVQQPPGVVQMAQPVLAQPSAQPVLAQPSAQPVLAQPSAPVSQLAPPAYGIR